uniref:Non-specific protein-tyrosine kinase n=1 Tax=Globodera rostochiensis TaxID=31243 RepID=A0A914HXT3_GLORO
MRPIEALKFSLMNCAFFYRPPLSFRETAELLERDGDFLVQDSRGAKLLLSVRVYGVVSEFGITIVQHQSHRVLFEFAENCFASLEELVLTYSRGRSGKHFLKTPDGDEFVLIRPILRQSHVGRFGYGERMEVRDCLRKGKWLPSFVRTLRPEFAAHEKTETDLERLIELDHRNLVRICDYFKQLRNDPSGRVPVVIVRFELVTSGQSLFDKLFHLHSVLNAKQYISWAFQAGNGLCYLMDHGFLHRRLQARACILDSSGKVLRIGDFWSENDSGDMHLFQRDAYLPNTVLPSAVMYRDGWRYLPTETLIDSKFDSASQVWCYALLVWQIYTHCQFGNRIYYSSLSEFLSLSAAVDDPYFMPGHLSRRQAQLGMPERRRQKMAFLKACAYLPHAPESLAEIVPRALSSNPVDRPYFCELLRVVEGEKRILDAAHVLGYFL